MVNENFPLGFDLASTDGKTNWDKVAAHPLEMKFAGIRTGISWGYQDKFFPMNWAEAKRVKIKRSGYHVVYPGERYTRQYDNLMRILNGDYGELPITLDCELDHGYSFDVIGKCIWNFSQLIERETSKKPILYSRADWIDEHITGVGSVLDPHPPAWLQSHYYWLAEFLNGREEHPVPPTLPMGVTMDRVLIHQTGELLTPPDFGTEAKELDYDRWIGPLEMLNIVTPEILAVALPEWGKSITDWARKEGYKGPNLQQGD